MSIDGEEACKTMSKAQTSFSNVVFSNNLLEINRNNSVLFSLILRKAFQLVGAIELVSTFLRTHFPLFNHAAAFKLTDLYVSNTRSVLSH